MSNLAEILVSSGVLTEEQRDKAQKVATQSRCHFSEAAVKLGFTKEDDIAVALSKQFGIPYASRENKILKSEKGQNLENLSLVNAKLPFFFAGVREGGDYPTVVPPPFASVVDALL